METTKQITPAEIRQMMDFYRKLARHNDKPWFEAHRAEYQQARATYLSLAGALIESLSKVDESLKGLSVNDCTYRIFKDVRFSKDKTPYKTWAGIFIAKGTKRGPYIGYYLHIEPATNKFFICNGTYYCDAPVLKSIREDLMFNGEQFEAALKKAKGFELDWSNSLKKVPSQYQSDSPYAEYFKLKVFTIIKNIDEDYLTSENLVERLSADFLTTMDFGNFINRAIDYAIDEWGYKGR